MKVEAISHLTSVTGVTKFHGPARDRAGLQPVSSSVTPATQTPSSVPAAPGDLAPVVGEAPSAGDTEKTRGVIRLLEAGHFKGVADVRLRINFFEELSARASANAKPVAVEQSGVMVEAVQAKVDELLSAFVVDESTQASLNQLVADFESAVQAAVADSSTEALSSDALASSIQAAFDTLVQNIEVLLAPPPSTTDPAHPIGDDAVTVSPTKPTTIRSIDGTTIDAAAPVVDATEPTETSDTSTTVTLDDAIAALAEAFSAALFDLLASIQSATTLSDPAPSNGHGSAYDKFLAIYNELRGVATTVDQTG